MSTTPNDPGRGDKLMTHDYDGIREYDNPTPGWWHAIFIGSCLFALVYFAAFHLSPWGTRWGAHARHDRAVAAAAAASLAQLGPLAGDEATLMSLSTKELALSKGGAIFATRCVACHRTDAGGMPALGPNLTDDYGKNIKTPEDIYRTVTTGVAGTAMVAWLPQMGKDDCVLAAAYVISLRGTNVPGGLEPNGEEMPAWPAPVADQ